MKKKAKKAKRSYLTDPEERMSTYLPPELRQGVKLAAAAERRPMSWILTQAVREYFDRHPPPGYTKAPKPKPVKPGVLRKAERLKADGFTHSQIAHELNAETFVTRRGRAWSSISVGRLLRGQ